MSNLPSLLERETQLTERSLAGCVRWLARRGTQLLAVRRALELGINPPPDRLQSPAPAAANSPDNELLPVLPLPQGIRFFVTDLVLLGSSESSVGNHPAAPTHCSVAPARGNSLGNELLSQLPVPQRIRFFVSDLVLLGSLGESSVGNHPAAPTHCSLAPARGNSLANELLPGLPVPQT